MCDIKAKERRKRYRALRKIGHNNWFARRARDFSEPHYQWHVTHPPNQIRVDDFDVVVRF